VKDIHLKINDFSPASQLHESRSVKKKTTGGEVLIKRGPMKQKKTAVSFIEIFRFCEMGVKQNDLIIKSFFQPSHLDGKPFINHEAEFLEKDRSRRGETRGDACDYRPFCTGMVTQWRHGKSIRQALSDGRVEAISILCESREGSNPSAGSDFNFRFHPRGR